MDVWECDLVDVWALGKFKDNFKYILSVIDVFSKFLNLVPPRAKTGTAVASAIISIFEDSRRRRRPVWVRTDKGKELFNKHFQEMLKREDIQFQVCRNPDVICSVVERAHRTIRDKLYNISHTKKSKFSRNLSGPTMTRFNRRRTWRRRE